jgi:hypothetical protein
MTVCLNCGLTQFVVPERELKVLATGTSVEGAVIYLPQRKDKAAVA